MKKLLAGLLSLSLLWGAAPAAAAEYGRPDWAASSYDHLHQTDIYPAYTSGAITRGYFLDLLVDVLDGGLPAGTLGEIEGKPADYFCDNYESQYWSQVMNLAAACGITEGWVDEVTGLRYGNFDATITRAEAAKMICTTLDFCVSRGYEIPAAGEAAAYSDAASIPGWAAPFTGRVAGYGIMVGDDELRFNPSGELDWPSAVVMASRVLTILQTVVEDARPGVALQSKLDWKGALTVADSAVAQPLTGYAKGYYAISNGDGTLSGLIVPAGTQTYQDGAYVTTAPEEFYVERYDAQGNVVDAKAIPYELPIFGAFLDGGDCFYLAFGQKNMEKEDSREVYRVVQYDRDWNKLGSVSVTGKDSYTTEPFRSTVSRMALSGDGKTVTLYAARTRYDGHQSNITVMMKTKPFAIQKVMGEEFPDNHVSHSFGQFVRYDGKDMVTVDHGDAYPRSFVLQKDGKSLDLLKIAGNTGNNVTHAIGSGFEVSGDGYLFLGCSTPQKDFDAEEKTPRQVFLAYGDKDLNKAELTWLTSGTDSIDTARLVKVDDGTFLVMWEKGGNVHYLTVDGKGKPTSEETTLQGAAMPTTQPVTEDGKVLWIGVERDRAAIYTIEV